jgi:hypothetical protein
MKLTYHELTVGRRLLKTLLPRAREGYAQNNSKWEPSSALGTAIDRFMRIDNVEAILIYEANLGGWHADFLLKKVDPGVANIVGTPVEDPLPSRQAAQERAEDMLMGFMAAEEQAKAAPEAVPAPPAFLFHGFPVELTPELLNVIGDGYSSEQRAVQGVEEMIKRVFPDGVPESRKGNTITLQGEPLADFMAILHMAALSGVFRYPPRVPAIIKGQKPA